MLFNRQIFDRLQKPNSLLVFLHAQRTGGSDLQRWMQKTIPDQQTYTYRTRRDYVHWSKLTDYSVLDGVRLVGGFCDYKVSPKDRPAVFLSNVRHPFFRNVSLYEMSRRDHEHFLHGLASQVSFEEFYTRGSAERPEYFNDLCTRRIAGVPDFQQAIEVIASDFGLVSCTHELAGASATLAKVLGWGIEAMPSRQLDADRYSAFLNSPMRTTIMENNPQDMMLFEYVASSATTAEHYDLKPRLTSARMKRTEPAREDERVGHEVDYRSFRAAYPGAQLTNYHVWRRVAHSVRQGATDNSLGTHINTGGITDFWEAGRRQAERLMKVSGIKPRDRVVEYGCGSLRIAAHFIKFLDAGNFFGMDIIEDFYDMGRENIGDGLLCEKRPRLAVIGDEAIAAGVEFSADFVFSHAVLIHVHRDDLDFYFGNLGRLAAKPGALLWFNAQVAPAAVPYGKGWAWPLNILDAKLPDFERVSTSLSEQPTIRDGYTSHYAMLMYRRLPWE